ncbi:MAG: cytochrome C, partial [Hylemonella sp.]
MYWRILACVWALAWLSGPAQAQSIESVIAPGKLIQAHAKYEDECSQCHVRFDRKAQDGRCMDCHKDVGADVRGKAGHHGKMKPQACRSCHTDHKGRDARIAEFDKKNFDHTQTDFVLRGKHEDTACEKCH